MAIEIDENHEVPAPKKKNLKRKPEATVTVMKEPLKKMKLTKKADGWENCLAGGFNDEQICFFLAC